MTNIKNIIFDLGGVIIDIRSEQDWYMNFMLPLLGSTGLDSAIEKRFFELLELGDLTTNDFYKNLKSLSDNEFSFDELVTAWNGRLLAIPDERIDLLYQLTKDYKLFLLSNTNQIHLDFILKYISTKFHKNIFEEVFEKNFYSYELQLIKPDIKIYETVLENAYLTANQTLFIDDNAINLDQPKVLGIQTIHFKNDEQFRKELYAMLKK